MTKTPLGLLFVASFCLTTTLSATTIACTLTSGSNEASNTNPPGNTPDPVIMNAVFTCTLPSQATIGAGNVLTSVDLLATNDYDAGTLASNNEVQFSYTTGGGFTGASTVTTEVIGLATNASAGASANNGLIIGQSGTPTCSLDAIDTFDCEEPGGSLQTVGSTFTVTGNSSWVSGGVQPGGGDVFDVSLTYTFAPSQTTTPEPATLFLVAGGGLVGLALAARRGGRPRFARSVSRV
jgi:hypothetical protein